MIYSNGTSNDLETVLKQCDWFVDKVKNSETYAQNLYAAMCNNQFVALEDSLGIISENYWSVSWRTAGRIVSEIIGSGDYLDWYCSGIHNSIDGMVPESVITDEITEDLRKLGWVCLTND